MSPRDPLGERQRPVQLAFDLPLDPRYGREDFLVSPSNERAYAMIESWPNWPAPTIWLQGPPGSGKSHLASIWAGDARAWTVKANAIRGEEVPHLVSSGSLAIEDLDRGPVDEASLFHLLNLARERGVALLLTASRAAEACGFRTADLMSRLRLAPVALLDPPDDALLKAVLVKLFVDRQLVVDTSVVDYLSLRIERSLAGAAAVVAELDREALSRGRRITRPMAAALFAREDGAEEPAEDGIE